MIYRMMILRYLAFRRKKLDRKKEKTIALGKSIHEMYVTGKLNIFEYNNMMAYRQKTIDSLNGQSIELDRIINDAQKWHIARKPRTSSSK